MGGKGNRISLHSTDTSPNVKHTDVLKKGDLQPGDGMSDQFECTVKGRLAYTRGKEDPHKMLSGGTIFIDHASGFVRVCDQVSLGAADTIRSKTLFEHHASEMGVTIKHYHGDNGAYKSKMFTEYLDKRYQTMT